MLVGGVAHARQSAGQVVAVDERQRGRAVGREPRHQPAPLAAARDPGALRDDEVAAPDLEARARSDVAHDHPRDGAVEPRAARQEPAAIEEAGSSEIADPQIALVHSDKMVPIILFDEPVAWVRFADYSSATRRRGG